MMEQLLNFPTVVMKNKVGELLAGVVMLDMNFHIYSPLPSKKKKKSISNLQCTILKSKLFSTLLLLSIIMHHDFDLKLSTETIWLDFVQIW